MKHFAFVVFLLTSTTAFGQKLSVGAELGAISSISESYESTDFNNRRHTYLAGVKLNYAYNTRLSFSTGLQYLRLGYRRTTCYIFEEGVKNELTGKIDYLVVPLLANVHMLRSRRLVFTFGLLPGVNIKAVQDHPDPIGGCLIGYIKDLRPYTQSFTLKGQLGLGYTLFETERLKGLVGVSFVRGFSNNIRNPYDFPTPSSWERRYHATALSLGAAYKL
ncbi:MAG: outer membrane beta-barrel protein [Sphingobacteriaceae bacterium]|nr:outer membrane beta-barrel protein [Sphingobacteriaceae bacterium]